MPSYKQALWSHFKSIGAVAKDKDRQRFFKYYGDLYGYRKKQKQRSMAVEQHFAKEFQAYMSRYKRGMMDIFQPSVFFHAVSRNPEGDMTVAWLRKPGKMLNTYQLKRYMEEKRLTNEARLRHAQRLQRRSIV